MKKLDREKLEQILRKKDYEQIVANCISDAYSKDSLTPAWLFLKSAFVP